VYKFQTSRGPDNRGAEIEMPKASRWKGNREGVSPPQLTTGSAGAL